MKMKKKNHNKANVNIVLNVKQFSVRIYPAKSSKPTRKYAGNDLGYMILSGDSTPPGLQFRIHYYADGTPLPPTNYNAEEKAVLMSMNWCQFGDMMNLLKTSRSVQGIYTGTDGVPWADVEGQFDLVQTRKGFEYSKKRKEQALKIKQLSNSLVNSITDSLSELKRIEKRNPNDVNAPEDEIAAKCNEALQLYRGNLISNSFYLDEEVEIMELIENLLNVCHTTITTVTGVVYPVRLSEGVMLDEFVEKVKTTHNKLQEKLKVIIR